MWRGCSQGPGEALPRLEPSAVPEGKTTFFAVAGCVTIGIVQANGVRRLPDRACSPTMLAGGGGEAKFDHLTARIRQNSLFTHHWWGKQAPPASKIRAAARAALLKQNPNAGLKLNSIAIPPKRPRRPAQAEPERGIETIVIALICCHASRPAQAEPERGIETPCCNRLPRPGHALLKQNPNAGLKRGIRACGVRGVAPCSSRTRTRD